MQEGDCTSVFFTNVHFRAKASKLPKLHYPRSQKNAKFHQIEKYHGFREKVCPPWSIFKSLVDKIQKLARHKRESNPLM